MTVYHHRSADHVAKHVLQKWRDGFWLNNFVSSSVTLAQSPSDFPSPDSDFQDFSKNTRISFEFKPYSETKRGMMTGLGQSIAYLRKANASYLVSPSRIDDFDMENFLKTTFETFIKGKLPVGLIIYDGVDLSNIRLVCDIDIPVEEEKRVLKLTEEPYWCWWRDGTPDVMLKLALSAEQIKSKKNRSKLVWDYFWDNFYALPSTRISLANTPSNVLKFDLNTKMIPFESIKNELRNKLNLGSITFNDALDTLKNKGWGQDKKENIYRDFKKNFTTPMAHINFWDGNKELTPLGQRFLDRNRNNPSNLTDEIAQIFLVEGKHENLINDIENISKELTNITDQNIYLKNLQSRFDELGYISKNPNRSTSGKRKFLQAEKQLWGHFSIIKKNKSRYFFPETGFIFDHEKINNLVEKFYKNYSDVSTFLDPVEQSPLKVM